jgi:hypothetical protein
MDTQHLICDIQKSHIDFFAFYIKKKSEKLQKVSIFCVTLYSDFILGIKNGNI